MADQRLRHDQGHQQATQQQVPGPQDPLPIGDEPHQHVCDHHKRNGARAEVVILPKAQAKPGGRIYERIPGRAGSPQASHRPRDEQRIGDVVDAEPAEMDCYIRAHR